MPATRQEVYEAIDGERGYQDAYNGAENPPTTETVNGWLNVMDAYLRDARSVAAQGRQPQADKNALEIIRKVTAIGVRCMEQHGAPRRAP